MFNWYALLYGTFSAMEKINFDYIMGVGDMKMGGSLAQKE